MGRLEGKGRGNFEEMRGMMKMACAKRSHCAAG